jgi:hypothetical protein
MGPWLANFLANWATRLSSTWAVVGALILAGVIWLLWWHLKQRGEGKRGVQTWQLLLVGLGGTWVFVTIAIVAASLWLYEARSSLAASDDGPLQWVQNFSMQGGMGGPKVIALHFRGANTSKKPIELKRANLISLIDGSQLEMEIAATDAAGNASVVPLSKIQLIPPGAPIELIAKFGPPDPANASFVLGMDPKDFLDKWRKFSFNATDDVRSYMFEFNETAMMPFFQGKVGPRVSVKP